LLNPSLENSGVLRGDSRGLASACASEDQGEHAARRDFMKHAILNPVNPVDPVQIDFCFGLIHVGRFGNVSVRTQKNISKSY
jgi:hypothetical protein